MSVSFDSALPSDSPSQTARSFAAVQLEQVSLYCFRNHAKFSVTQIPAQGCVISGRNGIGKTNVLEAISLLNPGKGLRAATHLTQLYSPTEPQTKRDAPTQWAVIARVNARDVATAWRRTDPGRRVKIDALPIKRHTELFSVFRCLWLTPETDGLIADSVYTRRRFLDQIIAGIDIAHAQRVRNLIKLLQTRLQLLLTTRCDVAWLSSVEAQIVAHASPVIAARANLIRRLGDLIASGLPQVIPIQVRSELDLGDPQLSEQATSDDIERSLLTTLSANRNQDRQRRRTTISPERHVLQIDVVEPSGLRIEAERTSTGQRKAALLSLLLAAATHIWLETGHLPILLLDDAASHLDRDHRLRLFACLAEIQAQAFFTGVDPEAYAPLLQSHAHVCLS